MKNVRFRTTLSLLILPLTVSLAGCSPNQDAAAGNREAARSAQGGTPAPRPLTPLEKGLKAYADGDRYEALRQFLAGAHQGNADAQYYAGLMFADGQGTKKNIPEAVKYYERAAAQNQPDALAALARFYVLNIGVEASPGKAVELYGKAAEAYPPGEKREHVLEQQRSLLAVLPQPSQPPAPVEKR